MDILILNGAFSSQHYWFANLVLNEAFSSESYGLEKFVDFFSFTK